MLIYRDRDAIEAARLRRLAVAKAEVVARVNEAVTTARRLYLPELPGQEMISAMPAAGGLRSSRVSASASSSGGSSISSFSDIKRTAASVLVVIGMAFGVSAIIDMNQR